MKAIIISASDWEGLFVDGKLVYENHEIERGVLRGLCKEYKLEFTEIEEAWVTEDYEDHLCDVGSFPVNLSDVAYDLN